MELDKTEPLKEECRHFLDCVASRKTPLSDAQEGLRVLRVLDACQQSLERPAAAGAVPSGARRPRPQPTISSTPAPLLTRLARSARGPRSGTFRTL